MRITVQVVEALMLDGVRRPAKPFRVNLNGEPLRDRAGCFRWFRSYGEALKAGTRAAEKRLWPTNGRDNSASPA